MLHKDPYNFLVSCSVILRMGNVSSDKSCRENHNTRVMFNPPPPPEYRAFCEIVWNNVEPGRPQVTIWRTRTACWIPKATKHTLRMCNTYCISTALMVV
jgi:hypothetical protein